MTVRWKESKPTTSPGKLFTASYMLTSANGKQTDWRNFATLPFHTSDTASPDPSAGVIPWVSIVS